MRQTLADVLRLVEKGYTGNIESDSHTLRQLYLGTHTKRPDFSRILIYVPLKDATGAHRLLPLNTESFFAYAQLPSGLLVPKKYLTPDMQGKDYCPPTPLLLAEF